MGFAEYVFFGLHIAAAVVLVFVLGTKDGFLARVARYTGGTHLLVASFFFFVHQDPRFFTLTGIVAGLMMSLLLGLAIMFFSKGRIKGGHVRGAEIDTGKSVARLLKNAKSRFSVGEVPVPIELETRGFLLAGSPGTGKSQTLTAALDALRSQNARAVIADASGIYASRYYQQSRDVIINPFDARCANWSPLAEIESIADIPALAKSMIPDAEGASAEWNNYAQTALEAILEYAYEHDGTNGMIFELASVADISRLREVFAGTPAAPLVAEGNERMWGSVRAIVSAYLKAYQYLDPAAGTSGFSIRKHIIEQRPGWIFLTYQQQHRDALKSLIGACVDIAARAVLSLPPDRDRRVVFALDEMPLLGKVQSIVDLSTNGRKHGAVIFAGLQTIAQVRDCYGRETAQTLLACLGSWLVLRVSDAETADYMSRYLGEEERVRVVHSQSTGGEKDTTSASQQYVKDRVVLPSELQQLPDLQGFFNLAGPTPTAYVTLQVQREHKRAEAFIPAPPRKRPVPLKHDQQIERAHTQMPHRAAETEIGGVFE